MLYVTQTATEVVRQPSNAELRVSQNAVEVLRTPVNRAAYISQIALEVLRLTPQSEVTTRQPTIIIVAG